MDAYVICLVIILIIMSAVIYVFNDVFRDSGRNIKDNVLRQRKQSLDTLYKKSLGAKKKAIHKKKGILKRFVENTEQIITKADVKITFSEFIAISAMFGIAGWLIGGIFNNLIIAVIVAAAFVNIPRSYLRFVVGLYRKQINEQLEPVLSQIINMLPTKKTLINACETIVGTMEQPLQTFFVEFINNINNANRSFEEAINELAQKIDCRQFYDFTRLALIHYRQGGDTVYAFSSIPENIRDIKLVQSEQEAELDSLRAMGYLFIFTTPLCLAYYYFGQRDYFEMLTSSLAGKMVMLAVVFNLILTIYLIKKISKPVKL